MISITNLHKNYNGTPAVNGITLNVDKGEMFGLVGPDGAGKTTTIRIMCGLLSFQEGEVIVTGEDIVKNKSKVQNKLGYLSQKFSLYGDLTIDENIEFFADIHNVKNFKERSDELLKFTRLIKFRDRLADKLSGGMKQKLALACSLIHKPEILFLDEPTTGVDPVSRRDFWKILSELLKAGLTVFMSTPYLDEAERCNRVAMMDFGKIIACDVPAEIKKSINKKTLEIVCDSVKEANNFLKDKFSGDIQVFGDRLNVIIDNRPGSEEPVLALLSENNIKVSDTRILSPSLENVFIHLVNKEN